MQRRLQAESARTRRQEDFEDLFTSAFSSSFGGFLTTPGPMTSTTTSSVEIDAHICDGKYFVIVLHMYVYARV